MRLPLRSLTPLLAAAGAAAAVLAAPTAAAQPLPSCVNTGGSVADGGSTTQCQTPGNVQINATPASTDYIYPWADEFYGPALVIGGGGWGPHGGGGGGGGHR
jgi:hypothetical protein